MNDVEPGDWIVIKSILKDTFPRPNGEGFLIAGDKLYVTRVTSIGLAYLELSTSIIQVPKLEISFEVLDNYIKPGDKIKIIRQHPIFSEVQCGEIKIVSKYRYEKKSKGVYDHRHKTIIYEYGGLTVLRRSIVEKIEDCTTSFQHKCTCETMVLVNLGCQCGGI